MTLGSSKLNCSRQYVIISELSMGWVDPWVGLGRDFSVFGGLGWVVSTTAKVNLPERIMLMHEFTADLTGTDQKKQ